MFEDSASVDFCDFLSQFLGSNSGGYIKLRILPPELESKIGQKFAKKRRRLKPQTLSTHCVLTSNHVILDGRN